VRGVTSPIHLSRKSGAVAQPSDAVNVKKMNNRQRPRRLTTAAFKVPVHALIHAATSAVILCVTLGQPQFASAHEGHEPLPTKGVSVRGDVVFLSRDARNALRMTLRRIDRADLTETLVANASVIVPWQQHAFVTTMTGGRVTELHNRVGDHVSAGDVIAEVESMELVNEQLEMLRFHIELELANQTLRRLENLGDGGVVAGKDVSAARAAALESSVALEITRRKLKAMGLSEAAQMSVLDSEQPIRSMSVLAPIAGTLVRADVRPGQVVAPTEHLFEIVNLDTVYAEANITQSEVHRIRSGQTVRVSVPSIPDVVFDGKIDYVGMDANAQTRSVPVWIVLRNDNPVGPRLRPGMFAQAEIVTRSRPEAITCPPAALIDSGVETYAFVEQAPGEYRRTPLVLGMRTATGVEVVEGIYPGDRVALNGSRQLATFFEHGILKVTPTAARNIGLGVAPAGPANIDTAVTMNAIVERAPQRQAFVSPQISGKVAKILVDVNRPVRAGQPVAELESLEFQQLQLDLLQAQSRLRIAEDLSAASRAAGAAIAQQQVLRRQTEVRQWQNVLRGLEDRLRMLGLDTLDIQRILEGGENVATLPIRAAIDGVVSGVDVVPGQVVALGQPMFEINDPAEVWVRGHLFERDMPAVAIGQTARITLASDPDFLATAKLVRTNAILAGSDRVLAVWASLENPDHLIQANLSARMSVSVASQPVEVAVPRSAILREGLDSFVFVRRDDDAARFDRRRVRTGLSDDSSVEITAGLTAGQVVAIAGVQALQTAHATIR
jgi:cobalt-zinc-cadmium efflux system membrane fusion protein